MQNIRTHIKTLILLLLTLCAYPSSAVEPSSQPSLPLIKIAPNGQDFITHPDNKPFRVWGFNYDHDHTGRLIEDYWQSEFDTIAEDFDEMKQLGANVIRIHLQTGKFMTSPDTTNPESLQKLSKLVKLAESKQLYLNLTGLGCYHKKDIPLWYDKLSETDRWKTQTNFWIAIAKTVNHSNAVFCYNLMNEPVLPGNQPETDWLLGEFGGKHFVQRLSLDLNNRTRLEVAAQWVNQLTTAIRKHDPDHLITVGVIPWALTFPKAKPIFYDPEVAKSLDFVSVHFYPQKDKVEDAINALKVYDIKKPIVIEEIFPLQAPQDQTVEFINRATPQIDGLFTFYWGRNIEQLQADNSSITNAIMINWLQYFKDNAAKMKAPR